MTKKQKHLAQAEELYVEKQVTLREIAERLPVGYSTLRRWKDEEDWDRKKKDRLLEAEAFHRELYQLAREVSKSIREDLAAGKKVTPARYYAIGRLMDTVGKSHVYEQKIGEAEKEGEKGKTSLKDLIKTLETKLFSDEEN